MIHAQHDTKHIPEINNVLWFNKPATQWEEALPLGNGRLGMMPDGGIEKEHIVLNDITMWSGSEANYNNPEASSYLPAIRQLLFQGKNKEAQEMMYKHFVPVKPEKGGTYGAYQVLGNLDINYQYSIPDVPCKAYKRLLNLGKGISTTRFTKGTTYTRTYFVSRTHDVMVIHFTTPPHSNEKQISFFAQLSRPERAIVRASGDTLIMEGNLDSGKEGLQGVCFTVRMLVKAPKRCVNVTNKGIQIKNADEATLYVSAATSFENKAYRKQADSLLKQIVSCPYSELEKEYITDYQQLFKRTSLFIGKEDNINDSTGPWLLPTDERIRRFQKENDPALAALYYNYGRYLLISSTRPGSLPPNLQGLWANGCSTPWNGDYHLNINVQMNHWPVEQGNLSELHLPLIELTKGLVKSGEATAKAFYGNKAKGWVAHMMTNVWHFTAPGEHPSWGATNTGGAWLCAHLWEHYLYNPDKAYLKEIYPVMKGASEFFLSTMVKEPTHGWLVTAPTSSPENSFYMKGDDTPISVCMGSTMDNELINELYTNVIQAASILNVDSDYKTQLRKARKQLPPLQISKEGYLMEWLEDYKETDIHHRHVSHLYGLHPGNQITLTKTPELAEACRITLNRRGDEGTGWSRAWKINFWARLGDGNRAYKLFKSLLTPAYAPETPDKVGGGTFPNLFCSHPPFQMDGNWGGTSGIGEMLLQSHDGFIDFLPALPDTWAEGSFTGFRVRGGATVSLNWKSGKPTSATIKATVTNCFKIKKPKGISSIEIMNNKQTRSNKKQTPFLNLKLRKGEEVYLIFK
ncbi:glycoside hydrolase family 95 protein [uncultured Bacteroides sp.]|uniref:glycoside hydrolase family 95 protein n=1 Tax=uncultured Bacteroides sp. TaxID=162156 RepID=UPI002AA70EE4|nr:glycoside hydrolase family 95 protein [uncultured Bacteroides sp.]